MVVHRWLSLCLLVACANAPAGAAPPGVEAETMAIGAPELPQAAQKEPPSLLISALGDCTLGSVNNTFTRRLEQSGEGYAYNFGGVARVLSQDDLTIANLEGPLTTFPRRKDQRVAFQGKPAFANILVHGSVEAVNVANNHYKDCGNNGARQTHESLDAAGVASFGWERVHSSKLNGIEVHLLGFEGGHTSNLPKINNTIRRLKRPDNLVVVSYHWGMEGSARPTPTQYELGRATIDAGADLILGHHPHVLQGIERYRGKTIVYSLGNFVFGGDSEPDDMDSMIYQARFTLQDGRVVLTDDSIIPVSISSRTDRNDYRPRILDADERRRVADRIDRLSRELWRAP